LAAENYVANERTIIAVKRYAGEKLKNLLISIVSMSSSNSSEGEDLFAGYQIQEKNISLID